MDTTGAPATNDVFSSMFGPEPTPAAAPVAVPETPELAPNPAPPVSSDPNAVNPQPAPEPAPVAPPPAPVPAPQPQPHMVPLPELLDTRRRAQAAEAALQQMQQHMLARDQQFAEALHRLSVQQQPQPQPIDPVAEPERAFQTLAQKNAELEHQLRALPEVMERRFQEHATNERLNASEYQARTKHGDELVEKAREAAIHAGLAPSFRNQPDPYGALVQWYRTQEFAQKVGTDPAAYEAQIRQQERERVIAEFRQGRQPSNIPPTITSATNSASAPQGAPSDRDIFKGMFQRRAPQR